MSNTQDAMAERKQAELHMLVGMGFDANTARRAMEVNGWNITEAIADLTSGDVNVTSNRPLSLSDEGLNSLTVPQRSPGQQNRADTTSGRHGHHHRRDTQSRRRAAEESDSGPQQSSRRNVRNAPPAARISQYDATTETAGSSQGPSSRRAHGNTRSQESGNQPGKRHTRVLVQVARANDMKSLIRAFYLPAMRQV